MNAKIVSEITALKREVLPNDKLILFGSQARGDARPDSDWDLLVLLDKDKKYKYDYAKYRHPFVELGWKAGKYFSTKIFTLAEWKMQTGTPFYKNIIKDGIEIK